MRVLIIGSSGRFAQAFKNALTENTETMNISFSELMSQGLSNFFHLHRENVDDIVWTLGPGNSQRCQESKEMHALKIFLNSLTENNISASRFHYLSTGGAMYGVDAGVVDECSPTRPVGNYGKMKLECEQYVLEEFPYAFQHINVLRIANAYTLDMSREPAGLIETLFQAMQTGEKVHLTRDVSSIRQYGNHLDYARYIVAHFLDRDYNKDSIGIYNVASSNMLSISEIVSLFERIYPNRLQTEVFSAERDTVILMSRNFAKADFKWKSLEEDLISASKF